MEIKVIITGSTGMVGEGVLLECLDHPDIGAVLMVNRKHFPISHPKLKECIIPDFFHLEEFIGLLTGYDACFFLRRDQFGGNERRGIHSHHLRYHPAFCSNPCPA